MRTALRTVLERALRRPSAPSDLRALLVRFRAARRGGVATLAAFALPVVALAAVGGVQVAIVTTVRARTQDVADSTALMAAQQLGIDASGARSRASAWATAQLSTTLPAQTTFNIATQLVNNSEVQVTITTNTPSFFGPELPVGGFPTTVTATAQSLSSSPLCVLATASSGAAINVTGHGQLSANCLVYSDWDVTVAGQASVTAPETEAVNNANGAISPAPLTGAQPVADPFAALDISFPATCPTKGPAINVSASGALTAALSPSLVLVPGGILICSDVSIGPNASLTLPSGLNYYFAYDLSIGPHASLSGSDVALFLAPNTHFNFNNNATVNLGGRHSGPYAGFVMVMSRAATGTFNLPTDPIATATGAIYSPSAIINAQGSARAGQGSDWTVIVAKGLTLTGSPILTMNANYAVSQVPTPSGVGPTAQVSGSTLVN